MKDYIEESFGLFREELSTKVLSSAKKGLHNIDVSSTRLEKIFRHLSFHSCKITMGTKNGKA